MIASAVASAPGKLMIFGEHAVIYGQPCIVTAFNLRIQVKVEIQNGDKILIQSPLLETYELTINDLLVANDFPKEVKFVCYTIRKFIQNTGIQFGCTVTTNSQFTHSYGLGSSSAVTVALMRALFEVGNIPVVLDKIFALSYEAVLEAQQGEGSGFDVAAATYGGLIKYKKWRLLGTLKSDEFPLLVCYSGQKADTVDIVKEVGQAYQRNRRIPLIMKEIGSIVEKAHSLIVSKSYSELGKQMLANHALLQELKVSNPTLDKLVSLSMQTGAYGAKLSGAGGGDCIIALVPPAKYHNVVQALSNSGIPNVKVLESDALAPGVVLEERNLA